MRMQDEPCAGRAKRERATGRAGHAPARRRLLAGLWLVVALVAVLLALGVQGTTAQLYLVAALFGLLFVLRNRCERQLWRLFCLFGLALVSLRYLVWRSTETLTYYDPVSFAGALLLYGAEVYGISIGLLAAVVSLRPLERPLVALPPDERGWPSVDVLIPTYNESPALLETTLLAAGNLAYPAAKLRVYLLDDGATEAALAHRDPARAGAARARRAALQALCREVGATYLSRPSNRYAKAGNLNAALARTRGALLLVLDADHVPAADFLEKTVGPFLEDETLALVQTPHRFVNADSVQRNLRAFGRIPGEQERFYRVIQCGLDFWQAALFTGSAAVLRRRHLEAIGGFACETVTEDAETTLELHARGYRSLYYPRPMVSALAPETFTAFVTQRRRWAQGMVQILLLKRPYARPGLDLWQRLGYLSNCLYWLFPFARVVFLLAPALFLLFRVRIYDAGPWEILAYTVPQYWAAMRLGGALYDNFRSSLVALLYELLQSLFTLGALWQVLRRPTAPTFRVTPKDERSERDRVSPLAWPFYLLLGLFVAAYLAGGYWWSSRPEEQHLVYVALVWHSLNVLVLLAALGVLAEYPQRRASPRMRLDEAARLEAGGRQLPCRLVDVSSGGVCLALPRAAAAGLAAGARLALRPGRAPAAHGPGLPLVLRHVRPAREGVTLGLRFAPRGLAERRRITALAFADSERWMPQWRAEGQRALGAADGLFLVGRLALRHAARHLHLLLRGGLERLGAGRRASPRLALAPAWRLGALLALALLVAAGAARGEDAGEAEHPPAALRVPLGRLMAEPKPIVLRNDRDARELFVPLSGRLAVEEARLDLSFVNSIALAGERSQMRLFLNGAIVAQLPLRGTQPRVEAEVGLPREWLLPGFNRLRFEVAQHTAAGCEDPAAPELWTQIDTEASALVLRGGLQPLVPRLSDIDRYIGPALGNPTRFRILTAGPLRPAQLGIGAVLAQAVALRLQYKPARFEHRVAQAAPPGAGGGGQALSGLDQSALAGSDGFLVGTRDELARFLDAATYAAITGPYLAVYAQAADPRRLVFLVSGLTDAEVREAATVLSLRDFPLADAPGARVGLVQAAGLDARGVRGRADPGRSYRFSDLGYRTTTLEGSGRRSVEIDLFLPPDFQAPEDAQVRLTLDFSYGANLRRDSALNLYLNGIFERAIPLNQEGGAVLRDYAVSLPLRSFRPGRNSLRLEAVMLPLVAEDCAGDRVGELLATLFDSSWIALPETAFYARQPDLGLFATTGFPYASERSQTPVVFAAAALDSATVAATWTLAARLAQVAERPLARARYRVGLPERPAHVIAVGALADLDRRLLAASPLAVGEAQVAVPLALSSTLPRPSWLDRLLDQASLLFATVRAGEPAPPLPPAPLRVRQSALPARLGLALAFESPLYARHLVTLLTAGDREGLQQAVEDLVEPALWSQLGGDLATWRDARSPLSSQRAGRRFFLGEMAVTDLVRFLLSAQPLYWIGAVLLSLLVLALLTRRLLSQRARRLHGPRPPSDD